MNLKTDVSRKQSTPNFPKNEHFLPPDAHTLNVHKTFRTRPGRLLNILCTFKVCASGGKKCSFFGKFSLLSWITRFEIRPFALLPTFYQIDFIKTLSSKKKGVPFVTLIFLVQYVNEKETVESITCSNCWSPFETTSS